MLEEPNSSIYGLNFRLAEIEKDGYTLNYSSYLQEGWEILKSNFGLFLGYTLLSWVILFSANIIPFASLVITGPLNMGYAIAVHRYKQGKTIDISDFFGGFDHLGKLLAVSIVSGLITLLGLLFFILPGLYLALGYSFASFIVVFYKGDFWKSMEASRAVVGANWFGVLLFFLILALINLLGLLALGIGLLVTIPLSGIALYLMFADIFRFGSYQDELIESIGRGDSGL